MQIAAFSSLLFEAFGKVQDEVIHGVIHSVLVMIDGGNELSNKYLLDLIDREPRESLLKDIEFSNDRLFSLLIKVIFT